jgi:hypothetical protein
MDIELNWQRELPLKRNPSGSYDVELDSISESPGIYLFGRRFGRSLGVLYVGKATNSLRSRIKQQLNNNKLLNHVWEAKNGRRIVLLGEFKAKPRQTALVCLPIAEKALIRYFVSKEHDLVNVQGVKLRHHQVLSTGLHTVKDFPNGIQVEKTPSRHPVRES